MEPEGPEIPDPLTPHCPLHSQPQQQSPEEPADLDGDGCRQARNGDDVEGGRELGSEVADCGDGVSLSENPLTISDGGDPRAILTA